MMYLPLYFSFSINQFEKGLQHHWFVGLGQIAALGKIKKLLLPLVAGRWLC